MNVLGFELLFVGFVVLACWFSCGLVEVVLVVFDWFGTYCVILLGWV